MTVIFTDGSSMQNKYGGWAAILQDGPKETIMTGSKTTADNMEMELTAVVNALAKPDVFKPIVVTDFLYGSTTGSIRNFIESQGRKHQKRPGAKSQLWRQLAQLAEEKEAVFKWVKGHASTPGNIKADRLAGEAATQEMQRRRFNRVA